MRDTDLTPAEQQAAFLHAVADHLGAHPGLATANVTGDITRPAVNVRMNLQLHWGSDAGEVAAWARSVNVDHATVFLVSGSQINLNVDTELGGVPVRVWTTTRHGARLTNGQRLTLDELDDLAPPGDAR